MADIKIKNVEANQKQPLKAKIQLKKDKKEFYPKSENLDKKIRFNQYSKRYYK